MSRLDWNSPRHHFEMKHSSTLWVCRCVVLCWPHVLSLLSPLAYFKQQINEQKANTVANSVQARHIELSGTEQQSNRAYRIRAYTKEFIENHPYMFGPMHWALFINYVEECFGYVTAGYALPSNYLSVFILLPFFLAFSYSSMWKMLRWKYQKLTGSDFSCKQ